MIKLFDNITATACAELDTRRSRDVLLLHEVAGGVTGGYCSVQDLAFGLVSAVAAGITAAARVSGVVTITTEADHGLLAGQTVVIDGVVGENETEFSGTVVITDVPDTDTFTYAQAGDDDTGAGGTARRVVQIDHPAAADGGGSNLPTADQATGYTCVVANCADFLRVTCHVTDGAHTVYARLLPEG